jgi:rubrerythrin
MTTIQKISMMKRALLEMQTGVYSLEMRITQIKLAELHRKEQTNDDFYMKTHEILYRSIPLIMSKVHHHSYWTVMMCDRCGNTYLRPSTNIVCVCPVCRGETHEVPDSGLEELDD